jgi:hypothetical protein
VANCVQGAVKSPWMLQFASCTPNLPQYVAGLKQLYTPVIRRSTETWQFRHIFILYVLTDLGVACGTYRRKQRCMQVFGE